jgi:hypothetical protein
VQVGIVMRALVECSEKEMFDKVRRHRCTERTRLATLQFTRLSHRQITAGDENASFTAERVEIMLQEGARLDLRTRAQCLAHLGKHFRPVRGGNTLRYLPRVRASHLAGWCRRSWTLRPPSLTKPSASSSSETSSSCTSPQDTTS